jgi:ribosomal protein S7
MGLVGERTKKEPLEVFTEAMKNATPLLQVKARRVGGATYQVPVEISPERGQMMAIRWLVDYARSRAGRTMAEKLASELADAPLRDVLSATSMLDAAAMKTLNTIIDEAAKLPVALDTNSYADQYATYCRPAEVAKLFDRIGVLEKALKREKGGE